MDALIRNDPVLGRVRGDFSLFALGLNYVVAGGFVRAMLVRNLPAIHANVARDARHYGDIDMWMPTPLVDFICAALERSHVFDDLPRHFTFKAGVLSLWKNGIFQIFEHSSRHFSSFKNVDCDIQLVCVQSTNRTFEDGAPKERLADVITRFDFSCSQAAIQFNMASNLFEFIVTPAFLYALRTGTIVFSLRPDKSLATIIDNVMKRTDDDDLFHAFHYPARLDKYMGLGFVGHGLTKEAAAQLRKLLDEDPRREECYCDLHVY